MTDARGPDMWGGMRSAAGSRLSRSLRRRLIPILIGVAVLAALFFVTTGASLPDDGDPIPVSGDEALAFAMKMTDAVGDAQGTKAISITVTDTEVTSFLSIASLLSGELKDLGGTGDLAELTSLGASIPSTEGASVEGWRDLVASQGGVGTILTRGLDLRLAIREPEVRFTSDGEIIVRGFGKVAFVSVPVRLVVKPTIVDGDVEFELVEGQFGRLPLPGAISNVVEGALERALLAGSNVVSVEQITVEEGVLRFEGKISR
ncbi:MAG: hypothetical protein ACC654_05040 [Acidimicrobiia bacterium]